MTIVYDYPAIMVPADSKVRALTSRIGPGLMFGGPRVASPEPGGLMAVDFSFATLKGEDASRLYGWVYDQLEGGASVFLIRLMDHVETVRASALGLTSGSIPFSSNGVTSTFSDGTGFALSPTVEVAEAALDKSGVVKLDVSQYGRVLKLGHLIGFGDTCNRIMGISYSGDIATIELRLPLRAALVPGQRARLWPRIKAQASPETIGGFKALHRYGRFTQPGPVTFEEYDGP